MLSLSSLQRLGVIVDDTAVVADVGVAVDDNNNDGAEIDGMTEDDSDGDAPARFDDDEKTDDERFR